MLDHPVYALCDLFCSVDLGTISYRTTLCLIIWINLLMHAEYGYGAKTSTSGDVYSYGIMLLEMITGKSPIDQMFGGEMNLEKWVRSFLHQAGEVVDKRFMIASSEISSIDGQQLIDSEDMQVMLKTLFVPMLDVALSCIRESPDARISMHDALSWLKRINENFSKSHNVTWISQRS